MDKIKWYLLSSNPGAIPLLEKNLDKVNWHMVALNKSPDAVKLFEKHQECVKLASVYLSQHPFIFEVDVKAVSKKIDKLARMLRLNNQFSLEDV
jgi:hypothetical protein